MRETCRPVLEGGGATNRSQDRRAYTVGTLPVGRSPPYSRKGKLLVSEVRCETGAVPQLLSLVPTPVEGLARSPGR